MSDANTFIIGDWGTSRLRLYLIREDRVEDRLYGPGIGELTGLPKDALRAAIEPWGNLAKRAIVCGMAGSRNGLIEVPYLPAPVGIGHWRTGQTHLFVDGLSISVAPGLRSASAAEVPDVMRGEETQIFGAMRCDPRLQTGRHLLVLPGTHSKWVDIEDGVITEFRTYMTGEMFALLRTHSTLLRAGSGLPDIDADGFACGLNRAQVSSNGLARHLFEARSAQLLHARSPAWAAEFLSGLLIGDEAQGEVARRSDLRSICLVGEPMLTARYRRCLQKIEVTEMDGERCAIEGLLQLSQAGAEMAST